MCAPVPNDYFYQEKDLKGKGEYVVDLRGSVRVYGNLWTQTRWRGHPRQS